MIKKAVVIGIVIVFLVGSLASGITINLKDSVKQSEHKNPQYLGDRDSGLVAYWDFDEGIGDVFHDVSGNGNDGIIENATWTTNTPSGYGYALEFDGINDYVEISDVSDFIFKDESVTFSAWIQIVDNLNEYRTFIYLGDSDDDRVPYFFMGKSRSGYLDGRLFMNVNTDGPTTYVAVSDEDGETLPKNIWIHMVGVVDYNNLCINLYINGSLEDSVPFGSYDLGDATQLKLRFGIPSFTIPGFHHKGMLDEIRIYNRALSDDEILYLYNNPGVGDIVYVDDDFNESSPGWGIDHFDLIQDGVDAVNVNGTVFVNNGTYFENVYLVKSLTLIGEDKNTTIIDGGGNEDVIHVSADNVNVSNFLARNSGNDNGNAGIEVNTANGCTISNNNVSQNQDGIHIDNSDFNNISHNNVYNNNDDGIDLDYSNYNYIFENTVKKNVGAGIGFSYDNTNNIIYNNNITSNLRYGIDFSKPNNDENKLYHNNLIANIMGNACDYSNNIWDNDYPSGGNYWEDYTGEDTDGDGIGDTPYNISCGSNQDLYPLIFPWGNNPPDAPIIDGSTTGIPGEEYFYKFVTNDPDADTVYLWIEWGDNITTGWIGPYNSGEEEILSHTWTSQETYTIKAKAKDIWGAESEWGTFTVTMPRNRILTNPFLLQLLERFPILQRLLSILAECAL